MGPSLLPLSRQIQSKASQSPGETGSFLHCGGIKAEPGGRTDMEVLEAGVHLAMAIGTRGRRKFSRMFPPPLYPLPPPPPRSGRGAGHTEGFTPPNTQYRKSLHLQGDFPRPFLFFYESFLSSSLSHFFPLPSFLPFFPPFQCCGWSQAGT